MSTETYHKAYRRGWQASVRATDGALDRADARGESNAWYDGYMDHACDRPMWAALDTTCLCAHNTDGSVTTMMCPLHAKNDPCWMTATVTGQRRRGSIVKGVCTNCGWTAPRL